MPLPNNISSETKKQTFLHSGTDEASGGYY